MKDSNSPFELEGSGGSTTVLLEAASRGDERARDLLLERYEGRLRSLVRRHLGESQYRNDGEDLLQTVRLTFVQSLGTVRERSGRPFWAWVNKMVRNKIADWSKAKNRKRRNPGGPQLQLVSTLLVAPPSKSPTPSQIIMSREQHERLEKAIEEVPERYREVLRFVLEEGPTSQEVAEFLGKTPGASRKFLSRAIGHLRAALQSRGIR